MGSRMLSLRTLRSGVLLRVPPPPPQHPKAVCTCLLLLCTGHGAGMARPPSSAGTRPKQHRTRASWHRSQHLQTSQKQETTITLTAAASSQQHQTPWVPRLHERPVPATRSWVPSLQDSWVVRQGQGVVRPSKQLLGCSRCKCQGRAPWHVSLGPGHVLSVGHMAHQALA